MEEKIIEIRVLESDGMIYFKLPLSKAINKINELTWEKGSHMPFIDGLIINKEITPEILKNVDVVIMGIRTYGSDKNGNKIDMLTNEIVL